ncbi:hypothetical protein MTR_8g044010 [Medicago truncatula]|uniref:Uncharacterized protein n=1 Tax=Medicago truncatula TaxID=3880 RepID=G7L6Z4_MEDTR|nr:hypothetical protein MTR_8g044010 [Medicago truncatula]
MAKALPVKLGLQIVREMRFLLEVKAVSLEVISYINEVQSLKERVDSHSLMKQYFFLKKLNSPSKLTPERIEPEILRRSTLPRPTPIPQIFEY